MAKKKNSETSSQDLRELYIDERTEDKIQEHLTNEEDIITEQDIANAPVGIVAGKEIPNDDAPITGEDSEELKTEDEEEEDLLQKKRVKDNDDPEIDTAWNVLGS